MTPRVLFGGLKADFTTLRGDLGRLKAHPNTLERYFGMLRSSLDRPDWYFTMLEAHIFIFSSKAKNGSFHPKTIY